MMNDYNFWNNYLNKVIYKIDELSRNKEKIYTDFHIHTDYSADGKQTFEEVINRAKYLGLDIIAITDHDSIDSCDNLYNYIIKNDINYPIIIPGVEFTIENNDYGNQCHILQLMINPNEEELTKNVRYNKKAQWNRIRIQFKRILENKALQYYIKKYNIVCTEDDYKMFLRNLLKPIPEYNTLMQYIQMKLIENKISNWDIFRLLVENNTKDKCTERRDIKSKRYNTLEKRYKGSKDSYNDLRFLHSMLAVKGADDDFFPNYKSEGSLSVNYFDELKINELNKKHLTFIAHPSEDRLNIIDRLIEQNNNICGIELNKQCKYTDAKLFYEKAKELNLLKIIGSDSHDLYNELYNNMSFYNIDKIELNKFIKKAKKYVN